MAKSEITVTMPIEEYNAICLREEFWQDRYNRLYRVVRKYVEKDSEEVWRVSKTDYASLADDLEEWFNEYEDER